MQSAHATRSAANGNGNGARTSARQDLTRPVAVTDATFQQEVLESDVPVVVDFWAAWCGPCRMIGPVLEKLAGELDGRVKIAKVDVDQYQHYAQHYGVQGIPTLLFVRGGQVVDRVVGALPEPYLRQRVNVFANPQ
ncbi:MAG: thioredoxin [Anaerolineae bacterium]|nr:thioredoxin [Anaerolineae bacterium]